MSSFTIPSIFTAVDKFSAPLRNMTANIQTFAQKVESGVARFDRGLRKLTPSLGEVGKQVLAFASAATVVAFLGTSAKAMADYETAVASFRTIVGGSDADFSKYQQAINDVARDTRKSSIDTAAAFEKIASLNAKFAETSEGISAVSKAAITLSKASKDELGSSAESLVGIMNQFSLGAKEADRTINVLAAGAGVGAASIIQTAESMKNFGSVAAGANISLEQSVAMVQTLGKFSVFGAEAGTKLRGSVLKLQQAGVGYASGQFKINDALAEARAKMDKLKTAKQQDAALTKMFGAENISTGRILLSNIALFDEFTKGVTDTKLAQEQAAINSNTFSNRLAELHNTWINLITTNDKASGALGVFKNLIVFVTDNLETIVGVIGSLIGVFTVMKIGVLAARASLFAYNVVLGVSSALSSTAAIAVASNSVAMSTYTAVQWLANAALWGFPLVWIIGAFIAVGAGIAALIIYWEDMVKWVMESDSVFAKLIRAALFPIIQAFKLIGAVIDFVVEKFGQLIEWVQTSDSGLAKFARGTLSEISNYFDSIGTGIEIVVGWFGQLWEWILKIGGGALEPLMKVIDMFSAGTQKEMGVNLNETKELINPKLSEQSALVSKLETTNTGRLDINVAGNSNAAKVESSNIPNGVKLSSTMGS